MSDKIVLSDDDVVSIPGPAESISVLNFGLFSTFKSSELINAVRAWIAKTGHETGSYSTWFRKEGLRCQVLYANSAGWKSGKVRFRIEFIPDEPEVYPNHTAPSSPLDDLRSN